MTQDPRLRLQTVVPDDGSVRRGWPTAPPGTPGAGLAYDEAYPEDASFDASPERGPGRGARGSAWDPPARGIARWLPASWVAARWDPGRWGAVALAAVVVVAAVLTGIGVWGGRPVAEPVPVLPVVAGASGSGPPTSASPVSEPGATPGPAPGGGSVVVHVAGKVGRPGLVTVREGARVGEAVEAAGGALPKVDLTPLNLAARVVDGQQIVVGTPASSAQPAQPAQPAVPAAPAAPGASAATGDGKVDLNAATLEQLDGLPGVGPVTAKKILDWRTQNGRFAAVEQLREIPGIGEARFGTLRELVRV